MDDRQLLAKPFNLDADGIAWVRATLARLTPDDKIRQLFNLRSAGNDPATLAAQQAFRPGSITRVPGPDRAAELAIIAAFNRAAPSPLLVSADLEGSRLSLGGGTEVPNPLALAAIDDLEVTGEISRIMATEARATGINWSFTPVLDINAAFKSAIVATRGYGSDVATIERHALKQIEMFQANGVAATVKHWPGEGFDDRDQHLVTTVNPLSMEAWEANFGRLYRAAIAAGAMSVMSAHIALPAYVRKSNPDAGIEAYRPASISRLLTETLLRQELGFNGLIVSDATGMGGLKAWSSRADYLPQVIAAGCDVILFADDAETDYRFIAEALADGRLSWARVDEAILRQLALKAALGLHRADAARPAPDMAANRAYAEAVTRRAPTLVKDIKGLLPINPQTHKRVLVFSTGIIFPFMPEPLPFALPDMLRGKGFEVTLHAPGMKVDPKAFDLVLYLFGEETLLTRGHIFLDWLRLNGDFVGAMQRYWSDVPTLLVSFGYPYYLYDAPRAPAYINAYSTTETMQRAVVEALLGNQPWNRHSPVDPFAGDAQARY
ncbi:MAG: glycoside hydrolase family 3 protein [Devosia nanyangense]|uniref:beta-N-acetylhexosaminidase n=1 Tax=Devosia nanyangense TaxID=1228055 RepID=A0A933NWI0_9HYPH|nr:glycoside hydrolase family 3 protein [Devosia nanyangense]